MQVYGLGPTFPIGMTLGAPASRALSHFLAVVSLARAIQLLHAAVAHLLAFAIFSVVL